MAKTISEELGDKYERQGYIHQSSHKWQAEYLPYRHRQAGAGTL